MKRLLNTLFVLSEDSYLKLDRENIVIEKSGKPVARFPLHTLESICSFSYAGASPRLMEACIEHNIDLSFFSPNGKYLASVCGEIRGNVLLRKEQYRLSDVEAACLPVAKNMLIGKIYNSNAVLRRAIRDYPQRIDVNKLQSISDYLAKTLERVKAAEDLDALRGIEGGAASQYFSCLDELILQNKDTFYFNGRNKRPPRDPINAMLSFSYTLLARECASALYSVGLDPYVGFLHRDRPGRISLALDLMEELRSIRADRFVITLINNRVISSKHFLQKENNTCLITDEGRKIFLKAWQERKQDYITHPFLKEKISWGLLPYVQALLLSRTIRQDYNAYPPFLWK